MQSTARLPHRCSCGGLEPTSVGAGRNDAAIRLLIERRQGAKIAKETEESGLVRTLRRRNDGHLNRIYIILPRMPCGTRLHEPRTLVEWVARCLGRLLLLLFRARKGNPEQTYSFHTTSSFALGDDDGLDV